MVTSPGTHDEGICEFTTGDPLHATCASYALPLGTHTSLHKQPHYKLAGAISTNPCVLCLLRM